MMFLIVFLLVGVRLGKRASEIAFHFCHSSISVQNQSGPTKQIHTRSSKLCLLPCIELKIKIKHLFNQFFWTYPSSNEVSLWRVCFSSVLSGSPSV